MSWLWFFMLNSYMGCGPKKQPDSERIRMAEYKRLSQEMERHIVRERWGNAAETFQDMQELNVNIDFKTYTRAAEINQELGNVAKTHAILDRSCAFNSLTCYLAALAKATRGL